MATAPEVSIFRRIAAAKPLRTSLPFITLAALGIRLACAVIALHRHGSGIMRFGWEMGHIARSIVQGYGFGNVYAHTGATAMEMPLYPYLLAAIFKLFGIFGLKSTVVAVSMDSVFSALTCIPIYLIARRSFGGTIAIVVAWMWALHPTSIYYASAYIWETCLSALLLSILFLWTLRLRDHPRRLSEWFGYGLLWGITALTNADVLSLGPFFTLWAVAPLWRSRRKWFASAALVLIAVLLVLAPWQVRNYRTFHKFVPLRDNFWMEIWIGNDGNTAEVQDYTVHPSQSKKALAEYTRVGEIGFMQLEKRRAVAHISEHPRAFVWMSVRRFVYMWTAFWNLPPENQDPNWLYRILLIAPFTVLMLIGLPIAYRASRETFLPYAFALAIPLLVYYISHPMIRYRALIDPEIVILAALGLRSIYVRVRAPADSAGLP